MPNFERARIQKLLTESAALLRRAGGAASDAQPENGEARRRSIAYELFLSECRLARKTYRRLRRRLGLEKEEIRFVSLRQMPGWFENLSISARVAARLHGLRGVPGFAEIKEGVWMLDVADFEGWSFLAKELDERGNVINLVNFRSLESNYSFRLAGRSPGEQISKEDLCRYLDRLCDNFWRFRAGATAEWVAENHDSETIEYCVDRIIDRLKYSRRIFEPKPLENFISEKELAA